MCALHSSLRQWIAMLWIFSLAACGSAAEAFNSERASLNESVSLNSFQVTVRDGDSFHRKLRVGRQCIDNLQVQIDTELEYERDALGNTASITLVGAALKGIFDRVETETGNKFRGMAWIEPQTWLEAINRSAHEEQSGRAVYRCETSREFPWTLAQMEISMDDDNSKILFEGTALSAIDICSADGFSAEQAVIQFAATL